MREGLRSRTRLGKVSGGEFVRGESGGVNNDAINLSDDGLASPVEKKDMVKCAVKEEPDLAFDVSTSGNVDLAETENGSNMGCFSDRGDNGEAEVGKKAKKKDGSKDTVFTGGRVLRSSSTKSGNGKQSSNAVNDNVVCDEGGEKDGFEKVIVKKACEEGDECVKSCGNEKVELKKEVDGQRNKKRKRGRPPKTELKENDELVEQSPHKHARPPKIALQEQDGLVEKSPRKRGRPPKIELKEQDGLVEKSPLKRGRPPKIELKEQDELVGQSPRKRGRPPKIVLKEQDESVEKPRKRGRKRKKKAGILKGKKGSSMRDGANANVDDDTSSSKSSGKELEKKDFCLVKKNKLAKVLKTENNRVASPSRSNTANALVADKKAKSKEKKLVRDKIMEWLSAAGWTVDYRPRNGRDYNDAVYVSLDGKTHWSITKAYNRLKLHYEAGDGEGKVYGPGFKFTPIPEEDVNILTKVISKERNDKSKKRGAKGGKTIDGVGRKVKKEKPGTGAGMDKSAKRKRKRKRNQSLLEEGITDVRPHRMAVLAKDRKRHKTQNKKRCALLVRNTEEETDSEVDGYVPYNGKRTLLSWMIDLGTIMLNEEVHYMEHGRKLDGKITRDGIHCGCCNKTVTVSDFEVHAGSKLSDPLRNICIEGGSSLLQCMLDSWNKQDEPERKGFHFVDVAGEDPNDDTCAICGDGGDLICCDGCPSTFHQSCLDIQKFPSGVWHCIYCCCKFCGLVGGSSNPRDTYDGSTVSSLLTCHLCEEKYHRSCIEANAANTDDSRYAFFCGNGCQELSERLETLLGVKHEIEDGFSLTFIRRSDVDSDASQIKPQLVECNSKLAVALSIMDECFMPHIDHRSGINLINSILYNCGSNFKRLNHSGFITAILERGDEIISAASIRIHGNQLAEMPFIGTRYMYRRKGMCRRLLNGIEWALNSLNVEILVIPAVSEVRQTWTSVFGFEPLELSRKKIIKNISLLVFPHVDMLQKKIPKNKIAEESLIPAEVAVANVQKNHIMHKVANNCEGADSSVSDLIISADIHSSGACQIKDKTTSIESGCELPEGSLNIAPDITDYSTHDKSPEDVTFHKYLVEEKRSTENPHDSVSDTCCRAEDASTNKITSCDCIIPNHDEKPTDLDSQLNNGCATCEERQCPNGDCAAGEAVFTTNALVHHRSQNITQDSPINCEKDSCEVSELNADEAEACTAKAPNLQTNTNAGDCQSIAVSSEHCEKVVKGVNESSKPSNVAEANSLPADTETVPDNEPLMKGSSELAEPDLLVDQTARNNTPSLCSPNAASGVALHFVSAGSTS